MKYYIDFENVGAGGLKGIESLSEKDSVRIYYSNDPSINMGTVEKIVHSPAKKEFIRLPDTLKHMNLANAVDIIILGDVSWQAKSLGDDYIIIISNDKGFDTVIDEINIKNVFKRISRRGTINAPIKIANEKLKPALTETSSKAPEPKTAVKTDAKTETKTESKTETKTGSKTPEKSTAAAAKKTTAKSDKNNTTKVDMEAVKKLFGGPLSKYNVSKSDIMNIVKDTKTRCEINNKISKTYHNTDLKNIMTALKPLIKDLPGK